MGADEQHAARSTQTDGPFSSVADMSGNVFEWTGVCDETFSRCMVGGGTLGPDDSCAGGAGRMYPHQGQIDSGIRCCADPVVAQ